MPSESEQGARIRQILRGLGPLGWRAPSAVIVGLLLSVPLMVAGVLTMTLLPVAGHHLSGQAAILRELVQLMTYTGCALFGLLVSLGGVVALHGQVAAGGKRSLPRASARALTRSPTVLASVLLAGAWVAITVVGAPLFVIAALVRALIWQRRAHGAETDADRAIAQANRRDALISAVPYLQMLRAVVLVAFALTTAVLSKSSVSSTLRQARRGARGRTLAGVASLAAPMLVNAALSYLALPVLAPKAATVASSASTGAVTLIALYVVGTTTLGLALALLASTSGVTPTSPGAGPRRPAMPWRGRRSLFQAKPALGAATAALVAVALVSVNLQQSAPAQAATPADIVVNTLADSLTPDPTECQTSPVCSLRGALAYATTLATPPMTVTFSVSGTIATADTLQVPNGVTLDGHDGITLDGQNAHGVLNVNTGDSGTAALVHISVVNGKSDTAGAGVRSDTANLTLDHVHLSNNVSGVAGNTGVDGGAVEANYASVTVLDSTFDHNSALAGRGGAVSTNNLTWTNSTSYANYGAPLEAYGGALYSSFGGTVTHATVLNGGGISGETNNPLQVVNTLSDTDHGTGEFACYDVTSSTDAAPSVGNVDVTGSCGGKAADPGPVGPLADNGGSTPTVALLAGAGALGAADSAHCAPTDQRGHLRVASSCDAGAYQLSAGDVAATVTINALPAGTDLQSDALVVHVEVPSGYSPAGHLTVLDGATVNGPGVDIAPDGPGNTIGTATVPFTLTPGKHTLSVRFTPTNSTIAVSTSAPLSYDARADATAKITATAPLTVGQASTIHVALTPVDASAATLTPTGGVQISNGPDTTTVPLTAGAATLPVSALLRGTVSVRYLGDDNFRAATFSAVVSTSDVPSAATLTLDNTTLALGVPATATIHVAGGGEPAYGTVHLSVDGAPVDWGTLAGGDFSTKVPTGTLSLGTHTATVTYIPEAGWAASTASVTFQVVPAPVTATLTFDHPSITWGDFATGTVHLASSHDGTASIDLMAGNTVLTTTTATITGGVGSVDIPLFQLVRPATGPLHVRVTGNGFSPSLSPEVTLTVAAAQTAVLASVAPHTPSPVANAPMTLRVYVTPQTSHEVPIDGTLKVFLNGTLAGTFHVTQTSTDLQVTPTVGGMVDVKTEFTDTSTSPALLPSSDDRGIAVGPGSSDGLTASWGGAMLPGSTHLSVSLPGGTGALRIVDAYGNTYGSGTLTGGTAQLAFSGHATSYSGLSLVYGGDSSFAARTMLLPSVTITPWVSTTTLTAPSTTVLRDGTLTITAHVTGLPAGTAGQVMLTDGTDQIASVPLAADGTAQLPFTAFWLGVHSLHVEFIPADIDAAPSGSDLNVTVVDHAAPTVTITQTSPAVAGSTFTVEATVPAGGFGTAAGDSISLVRTGDPSLNSVASGTMVSGPDGLHATITVPSQDAGNLSLTAVYYYGIHAQMTTSNPLAVTVAQVTPTLTVSAAGPLTYGDLVTVKITADAPPALYASTGVMKAAVNANGVKLGDVNLFLTGTSPMWTGTLTMLPQHAGALTLDATTAGDGRSVGGASASTTEWVQRRATTLTLADADPAAPGRAAHGVNVDLSPVGGYGQLTVADLASVDVSLNRSTVPCVLSGSQCVFPVGAVPVGDSTAYATYPGSADFLPAYASTGVHAEPRHSTLAVTMDPPEYTWVAGADVHASWHTTTTGAPAAGTVYIDLGSSWCQGPALDGSCTVKVPPLNPIDGTLPTVHVTEKYVPSDDAPAVTSTDTLTPRACVHITLDFDAHFAPGTGLACGPGRFMTGAPVTVIADLPHNMHVDGWYLNGQPPPPTSTAVYSQQLLTHHKVPAVQESLTFTPTGDTDVRPSERWAPACFTLTMPRPDPRTLAVLGGRVTPYTAPNCSSPWMPTAQDWNDVRAGDPSYAEGTVVSLTAGSVHPEHADPNEDPVAHPVFALDRWVNATPDPTTPTDASVTMNADTRVSATFKVTDCTPQSETPSEGGGFVIVSTKRPDSSYMSAPASGACTTRDGKAGYVPGTTAVVQVVPSNDHSAQPAPQRDQYFLKSVTSGPVSDPNLGQLPAIAAGTLPDPSAYRTQNVTVELSHSLAPSVLHVQMAHIACVPVTTRLEVPQDATVPAVSLTSADCPAHPTTTVTDDVPLPTSVGSFARSNGIDVQYKAQTTTTWFVEGGGTVASGANTPVSMEYLANQVDTNDHNSDYAYNGEHQSVQQDDLHPVFALESAGQPVTADALGHYIPLPQGSNPIIVGRWMSDRCADVHVSLPTGGHLSWDASPQCGSGKFPSYDKTLTVHFSAADVPDNTYLTPWLSTPVTVDSTAKVFSWLGHDGWGQDGQLVQANGRWYFPYVNWKSKGDPGLMLDSSQGLLLQVAMCGQLNVHADVQGLNGQRSQLANQDQVVSADGGGGCPPGWGGYHQQVHVGLTPAGNYAYEILSPVKDQAATTTVDEMGRSPEVDLVLHPYCYHLDIGDRIDVQSPANCPGGGDGDYLKGSVVTLTAHVNPGDHFHGWGGETSSDGQTAYVAMTQDRSVSVDIGTASLGDKIAAGLSSTTQRILSGLITAATDLTVAELSVISVISLAIKGATAIATVLGAPSSVVDAMTSVSTDIDAQMNVVTSLSTCTATWAAGGSGTLLPGSGADGDALKAGNKVAGKLETKALVGSGLSENGAGKVSTVVNPVDLINGFGSHADNYLQDPNQAWSDIGSIGSCMLDTISTQEQRTGM